jgi:ATP-dependent Lhr-like helicase
VGGDGGAAEVPDAPAAASPDGDGAGRRSDGLDRDAARRWLVGEVGIGAAAARQIVEYLAESKRLLGVIPTEDTLVLERFFDEAGGMQLVLHAPFGSRVNRAWGLALRKRFCRQFNFELQAAATEEGVLLSLGPQHSFPLDDVFRYLKPETVREVLVQAVLDAPMFQTRWRWCTTLSLAQLRWRGGSKVPPQIQRMEAEDLLSAVFPDANACLENIAGEREVPDHPLVRQTLRDCLTDAMDLPRLTAILERLLDDGFELAARDTPEPSPLSHELVSARPYAFLDDAEAEERRTLAVRTRRAMEPSAARELGALDPDAVRRVRAEARPDPRNADELHDALLTCVALPADEVGGVDAGPDGERRSWRGWLDELAGAGRAAVAAAPRPDGGGTARFWAAAERLPVVRAAWPGAELEPGLEAPGAAEAPETREEAVRELVRGRLEVCGPTTAPRLAGRLALTEADVERSLLALEDEGTVLRGHFTPAAAEASDSRRTPAGNGDATDDEASSRDGDDPPVEWCHRRLLARIHRLTLERLRAEVSPVSARNFMRFLFRWQRAEPGRRLEGREGVAAAVEQLEGFEVPAAALEADVLAARVDGYDPADLDALCTSGRAAWGRLTPPSGDGSGLRSSGPLRTSPVALWGRSDTERWLEAAPDPDDLELGAQARQVLAVLEDRGASFFPELVEAAGLLPTRVEQALGRGLPGPARPRAARAAVAGAPPRARAPRGPGRGPGGTVRQRVRRRAVRPPGGGGGPPERPGRGGRRARRGERRRPAEPDGRRHAGRPDPGPALQPRRVPRRPPGVRAGRRRGARPGGRGRSHRRRGAGAGHAARPAGAEGVREDGVSAMATVYTVGHSTRGRDEFVSLLEAHGVRLLADVRRHPGSRRHPHFDREAMEAWLADAGVEYRHLGELGGRRGPPDPNSPNGGWRADGFQAYADHLNGDAGQAALDRLEEVARERTAAVMCAEAVPWRCHRRIIADHLVARGHEVRHVLGPDRADVHDLREMARPEDDGRVVYPAEQAELFEAEGGG